MLYDMHFEVEVIEADEETKEHMYKMFYETAERIRANYPDAKMGITLDLSPYKGNDFAYDPILRRMVYRGTS